jgi:hypothetical protein
VVPAPVSAATRLVPTDTASDGFAIDTFVLARLLGIRLLTLEGVVLVSPARATSPAATDRKAVAGPLEPTSPGPPLDPPGASLARASQILSECSEELRALESR